MVAKRQAFVSKDLLLALITSPHVRYVLLLNFHKIHMYIKAIRAGW